MHKIALITDSSCDLSPEIVKNNDISVMPLRVIYSDKEYKDGVDIEPEEIYAKLDQEIPKTSMPSPGDFINKLNNLKNDGYTHCIVITISSGLSGTYNMFKTMSQEISDIKIDIIDSKTLSMGLGFIVLEAAKLIKNNTPYNEIVEKINSLKSKVKAFFIVDTLEYLIKGGRIGRVAAVLGTVLNIKPIISIDDDGKYYTFSKARGKKHAVEKLLEPLLSHIENTKTNVAVLQGLAHEEALILAEKIKGLKNINSICTNQITPSLVVHTGPGLLGLTFYPAEY